MSPRTLLLDSLPDRRAVEWWLMHRDPGPDSAKLSRGRELDRWRGMWAETPPYAPPEPATWPPDGPYPLFED